MFWLNFFTVTGEEESHIQNPYPEFETELKPYSTKCFKSIRVFWRVRARPNHTPRPSSDSDKKRNQGMVSQIVMGIMGETWGGKT